MVRSHLAFLKHFAIAVGVLWLCVCSIELALHLYDACRACADGADVKNACAPSWTVHHFLKPDVPVVVTSPDFQESVSWRTNSLGLRGPEVEIPKPRGAYRIVCLGDESTLAAETPTGHTFCDRLQEFLRSASPVPIEVINAGTPQYGPLLAFLQLKHSLLAVSPDLVICNFDMSDVAFDHRCRRSVRMHGREPLYCPHPDLERQRVGAERFWIKRLQMWRHCERGIGYALGREVQPLDVRDIDSPLGTYAWLRDDAPDWSIYIEQTLSVVAQISGICRGSKCGFVLAVVPCPWQISAEASNGLGLRARNGVDEQTVYASRSPQNTLASFAKRERIAFCDALESFEQVRQPERLFLKNAARFSPTGHQLYARILSGFLVQNVSGPWGSGTGPVGRFPNRLSDGRSTPHDPQPLRRTGFQREERPTASSALNAKSAERAADLEGRPSPARWGEGQ